MTKIAENKLINIIQIEGVYLTPKAIDTLKNLQGNNNEVLDNLLYCLHEAIRYIASNDPAISNDEANLQLDTIKEVNLVYSFIKDLKKP